MRYFRRLPPLLRVASILGWLFFLAAIALWGYSLVMKAPPSLQSSQETDRVRIIALNLYILGLGCIFVIKTYSSRFRQPDRMPYPLDSWESQLRAIALMSAPLICALVLAVVISPASRAFAIVYPISIIGVVALLVKQAIGR